MKRTAVNTKFPRLSSIISTLRLAFTSHLPPPYISHYLPILHRSSCTLPPCLSTPNSPSLSLPVHFCRGEWQAKWVRSQMRLGVVAAQREARRPSEKPWSDGKGMGKIEARRAKRQSGHSGANSYATTVNFVNENRLAYLRCSTWRSFELLISIQKGNHSTLSFDIKDGALQSLNEGLGGVKERFE